MQVKARLELLVLILVALSVLSLAVYADPQGPEDLSEGPDERAPTTPAAVIQAQAGNVTSLNINATAITQRWQGYYGNISGTFELSDAAGNALYQWEDANPRGEIYASNDSITDWSDVFCFNFTNAKDTDTSRTQRFNGSQLETTLGMGATDVDGVDETFNGSFTGTIQLGTNTINRESGCSLVSLYVNDDVNQLNFNQTILTDNNSVIYTSMIEQSATGFQGTELDFQMIVGENGDTQQATDYYFYVQLT